MLESRLVLPQLLAARARERPDAPAVREVGGRAWTRAGLHSEALRWAAVLADAGVWAGDRVLVMLPTSGTAYAAWLGLGWLRAVEVPVNTQYRGDMLRYLVTGSRAGVIVIHGRWLERLREVAAGCPGLHTVLVVDGGDSAGLAATVRDADRLVATAVPATGLPEPAPWDLAAMLYTSGTTGPSKGVLVPWAQLHATAVWTAPLTDFSERDVAYMPFPSYHVSAKGPLYAAMLYGGSAVVRDAFSTEHFWSDIREYGCTYAMMLFSMARFLQGQPQRDDDADNPLDKLVMVPPVPEVDAFAQRFGVRVGTLFNMTETSVPLVTRDWRIEDPAASGRVRPGCQVRLVDPHDDEVEVGETGELIVRTDEPWTLCAGYWDMPEQTAFAWRNGWFHTGDAFRRDAAGNCFFVDRYKDAIRRRGENISSFEVEGLVAAHPAVLEASEHGEDEVCVYVVPVAGAALDPRELLTWLVPRMPRFMVPRYLEVVDVLPRTPTAKVRKVELRERGVGAATFDRVAAGVVLPRL